MRNFLFFSFYFEKQGCTLLPGTAYIHYVRETFIKSMSEIDPSDTDIEFENVQFLNATILTKSNRFKYLNKLIEKMVISRLLKIQILMQLAKFLQLKMLSPFNIRL